MELKDYLRDLRSDEARENFAGRCGTTAKYLRIVSYSETKRARLGADICINIERETHGLVQVESLRPDLPWHVVRGSGKRKRAKPKADLQ